MVRYSLLFALLVTVLLTSYVTFSRKDSTSIRYEVKDIPVCGPVNVSLFGKNGAGKYVSVLPGWGRYEYPVSTQNDSSQFYFNQGLNMYYSYHFKEALASFKESERIDPQNVMALWGQALAMGPYYNAAHVYTKPEEIPAVLNKMNQRAGSASPSEKILIDAMNSRYSDDPRDSDRKALNLAYAGKMKAAIEKDPDNEEFKVLYIDAMMLIHAWDFWSPEGNARAWTPELVRFCEQVLKTKPKHPAALHYHIHLTEASNHPEVALGSAEALRNLLPGVAHMVHMASHEYERNGLYAKGVEVNNLADDNLVYYDLLAKNLSLNKHSSHYFAVQTYCALTAGMYKDAMRYAERCRKSVTPAYENTYDQYLFMLPLMTRVRMGKWADILQDTMKVDARWTYAGILSDFARGLAYANTGTLDSARICLEKLRKGSKDPILVKRRIPFNSPVEIALVAENILNGIYLFKTGQKQESIAALQKAVKLEDALIYTEPKDWPIPSRQFLGAVLLKNGKPAAAEKVYREDLAGNQGNGWALIGLSKSLSAQKKNKQAATFKTQADQAFAKADEVPAASVLLK